MSRLHRGLWQVEAHYPDHIVMEPTGFALSYEDAATLAASLGEDGATRAILRRVPGSRASWEYLMPFEASDKPVWGEPNE